jgi:protein-S-isoprenylcysteine O-methyltransferase Ste14
MKKQPGPTAQAAHTAWWQIGEVVFGSPLLAAILFQWLIPLPLLSYLPSALLRIGGSLLIVIGIALIVLTRREFARYQQPTDPGRPTSKVITSGPFAFSRNPLYLGAALFVLGVTFVAQLSWMLLLFIPMLLACHLLLIRPEERYLLRLFGEEYQSYTRRVFRWFGRAKKL